MILLTPYIIKDQLDLQSIRERKVREREEFVSSFTHLNEMKYEPKIDYRRKRGVIEEINRSVQSVEEDLEVLKAMGSRQRVLNGPLEYAPSEIEDPGEPPPMFPPGKDDGKDKDDGDKPAPKGKAPAKAPAKKGGG